MRSGDALAGSADHALRLASPLPRSPRAQKAVKKKDLLPLLTQAREDNPLLVPPAGIDGPGAATTSL